MRKHLILAALAAAMALVPACQKSEPDNLNDITPVAPEREMTFSVQSENAEPRTNQSAPKTSLVQSEGAYNIVWSSGDQIRVNGYLLTINETDQPEGYGSGQPRANFTGNIVGNGPYRAWYPASLNTTGDWNNMSLPASQAYTADNIAGFPMSATSDNEHLEFKNLCGLVRINLKGDRNIMSIGLRDVDETAPKGMSGNFSITDDAAVISSGTAGVALECATPVALNTTTPTAFFLAVPAGSYNKLQITITAEDDYYAILTSNKPIVVERSKVTTINLNSLNFKNESAVITYTTTNTSQISKYTTPGADASVFGEGLTVVSHTYDAGTKTGVITLDGTITKIGTRAFASTTNLATVIIPGTVTTLENEAFYDCRQLTTINWPASLTSVGYRAFSMDMALTTVDLTHLTTIGQEAFFNCAPPSVTIDSNIVSLGVDAFRDGKMTSVTINAIPETFSGGAFYGCSKLESAVINCDMPFLPGYTFYNCDKLASVTFNGSLGTIGEKAFYSCDLLKGGIDLSGTGVTAIGSEAFRVTPLSSSFDIPSTVTSIGGAAFCECTGITSIHIPDAAITGNHTFQECTNLASVVLAGGTRTTALPYRTFYGCTKLASANIPACVTNVGNEAFMNCGLTTLPDGWGRSGITYGSQVFAGCPITHITFPDNWTSIPSQFCKGMSSLATVDFGSGLTSLGNQIFDGCWALTSVTIPAQMTTISTHAFYHCGVRSVTGMNRSDLTIGNNAFDGSKLQTADISNWTSVPGSCFANCSDLSSVTLGAGLLRIYNNGFQNCTSLTSISLPASLTQIDNYAFQGSGLTSLPSGMHDMTFGDNVFAYTPITSIVFPAGMTKTGKLMFSNCTSLTSVDLGGVTNVADNTFYRCYGLTSVNFSSVVYLHAGAFKECNAIEEIDLPNSLVQMYDEVFRECVALRRADIGTGITQMGGNCFYNCQQLETLTIRASAVPTLANVSNALNNVSNARLPLIYVPSAVIDTYKTATSWSNYSTYFHPLDGSDRSGRMEDYTNGGNL